jgi:toxin ParE1/3/4
MNRCHFTTPALRDLIEIHDSIAGDSPIAAARWIEKLEGECQSLAAMPGMGRRREDLAPGLRSFPVGVYLIFYREVEDGVQILRVLHGARDINPLFF